MGADSSKPLSDAAAEIAAGQAAAVAATPEGSRGTKLYRFVQAARSGVWELESAHCQPRLVDVNKDGGGAADWALEIEEGDIYCRADDALNYVAAADGMRVTFAARQESDSESEPAKLWALKFPSGDAYRAFMTDLEDAVFHNEYGFGRHSAKAEKELGDYGALFYNSEAAGAEAAPMEVEAAPEAPSPREVREKATPAKTGSPIEGMYMGGAANSYLRRGATFDVMRNVEGGVEDTNISFSFTPLKGAAGPSTPGRRSTPGFTPSKVLLANGESHMNMLSPGSATKLFRGDVEYQKIVSEWAFQKDGCDIPMADIANDNKAAQLEDAHTMLGLDDNRLCRWDFRDPRGVVQEAVGDVSPVMNWAGGKDFARGTNFSCMATSGDGHVVVGSRDGKIRLYSSKTLTQAKTTFPGLGKAISSVDVTFDGRWVLGTTDDYLILIKTTFDEDGKERSAFQARGGSKLTQPRLLRLKPEDRLITGSKALRNGRFTWVTESSVPERWLVASVGHHTVIWNFSKVKSARTATTSAAGLPTVMDYTLSSKDEDVVDCNFVHQRYAPAVASGGRGDALVVATGHKVFTMADA